MSQFEPIEITETIIDELNQWLNSQEKVFPFSNDNHSSLLICYVLSLEIGGTNDDLARFIYDVDKKNKIIRKNLKVQVGRLKNHPGFSVRITCTDVEKLQVTIPELHDVLVCNGSELIICPVKIANFIRAKNLTPVFVKEWLQKVAFSRFDLKKDHLIDQLWVLRNNDTFLYSKIVSEYQIVFQSIHDIVGHIAGVTHDGFGFAAKTAKLVFNKFNTYFTEQGGGNIPSHLIPFLIGLLLDDLTQKPFYFSMTRNLAIPELLRALDSLQINPQELLIIKAFPIHINEILQLIRDQERFSIKLLKEHINKLIQECHSLILLAPDAYACRN